MNAPRRSGRVTPFLLPALTLAVTVAAIVVVLSWEDAPFALLVVAAIGPPLSALFLARAAAGGGLTWSRLAGAAILGGTVVPILVILVHGAVLATVYGLVAPFAAAGRDLLDELRVQPELVDVLANPWSLLFLVELALVAPIAEESLKPLAARLVRPRSRREAFLLGAAAGAGFAVIEDLLYASGWWYSSDWWLPVAVLRSTGAALHLLGAGLISVALYERRAGMNPRTSLARVWGFAVGIHAFWNGAIAVTVLLFEERSRIGFAGSAWDWGIGLDVALGALGMLLLGALVVAARWAVSPVPRPVDRVLDLERPEVIAGWAGLAALMIIPATVLILVFPSFLAL